MVLHRWSNLKQRRDRKNKWNGKTPLRGLCQTNTLQSSRKTLDKLGKVSQQQKHIPGARSEGPVPKCPHKTVGTASCDTLTLESSATFLLALLCKELRRQRGNVNILKLFKVVKGYNILNVTEGSHSERKWKSGKNEHIPSSRESINWHGARQQQVDVGVWEG